MRTIWTYSCALALAVFSTAPCAAQDTSMEEFEEVDPYTENDPEKMAALGYVRYGPFFWHNNDFTDAVAVNMGDIPMLWVETEHFKIGSSLNTYTYGGDREEKARIEDELDRLEDKLGKFKAPKRKLDPWLRLHVYAQRAEELYTAIESDFGLAPEDYTSIGPHFGNEQKFMLLLTERTSEFSRHVSTYLGGQSDSSYRWLLADGTWGFSMNFETIEKWWEGNDDVPLDAVYYAQIVSGVTQTLLEGYRIRIGGLPIWLRAAYSHYAVRRMDPRWVTDFGLPPGKGIDEDDYEWERRVRALVKNKFFLTTPESFAVTEYKAFDERAHMVLWSRLVYLLEEAEGNVRGLISELAQADPRGEPEAVAAKLIERQERALATHFHLTPQELDEAWSKWVLKTYPKK